MRQPQLAQRATPRKDAPRRCARRRSSRFRKVPHLGTCEKDRSAGQSFLLEFGFLSGANGPRPVRILPMGVSPMSDAVAEKVIAALASVKRIPADTIKLDTNLQEMGIDSLDVFSLLFELENTFNISIPDDDVRSLRTVNDIVEGIKKIQAAGPSGTPAGSASSAD